MNIFSASLCWIGAAQKLWLGKVFKLKEHTRSHHQMWNVQCASRNGSRTNEGGQERDPDLDLGRRSSPW